MLLFPPLGLHACNCHSLQLLFDCRTFVTATHLQWPKIDCVFTLQDIAEVRDPQNNFCPNLNRGLQHRDAKASPHSVTKYGALFPRGFRCWLCAMKGRANNLVEVISCPLLSDTALCIVILSPLNPLPVVVHDL